MRHCFIHNYLLLYTYNYNLNIINDTTVVICSILSINLKNLNAFKTYLLAI